MGPETVMLIKILTDLIITATTTLSHVHQMTAEETKVAIDEAESTTKTLIERLRGIQNPDAPPDVPA